ncbi:L-threonylcarbamoyladenylate synthase type 1 TsaC [Buchnera aphidicola (Anoecia oenotherae)]|uniref:Threonylcarbamoyl-AMP synthase n=2 Tax=Buchnera aphidicola TaxID=9 RepID=A0A4D6XYL9_9GAMM|nr:L-threonylcarbamoyladenylate synthase type 1 TsaC [Buchnera aphidicola (Anoecia oenotherae)]
MMLISIRKSIQLLKNEHMIFYPTESVFGLGCDPENENAVHKVLFIKNRNINKGFILVSHNYNQVEHYIEYSRLKICKQQLFSYWKNMNTVLLPSKNSVPYWITGSSNLIAIRISKHSVIKSICIRFGKPIISTSANISGKSPCKTLLELKEQFGNTINIVRGSLGKNKNPSNIINANTQEYIRYE